MNTKKFLYATTAMVGASVAATGAQAEGINLGLSGHYDFFTSVTDNPGNTENVQVHQDHTINFTGSYTMDNGIEAGVNFELEGGALGGSGGPAGDEQYVYLKGSYGTVQLGSQNSAGYQMSWNTGPMWWRKLVPINSGWQNYFIDASSAQFNNFYSPGGSSHIDVHNDAQTIAYFTPRVSGFKFGASWTPTAGMTDQGGGGGNIIGNQDSNVLGDGYSLGANYSQSFNNVDFDAFASYQFADIEAGGNGGFIVGNVGGDSVEQYMFGLRLGYMGFAAGYQWAAQDNAVTVGAGGESQDGASHAFDIRYATGPWHAQAEAMISSVQGAVGDGNDEEQQTYKGSLAYTLGPGVNLSAALIFDNINEDSNGRDTDNLAGVLGTVFYF